MMAIAMIMIAAVMIGSFMMSNFVEFRGTRLLMKFVLCRAVWLCCVALRVSEGSQKGYPFKRQPTTTKSPPPFTTADAHETTTHVRRIDLEKDYNVFVSLEKPVNSSWRPHRVLVLTTPATMCKSVNDLTNPFATLSKSPAHIRINAELERWAATNAVDLAREEEHRLSFERIGVSNEEMARSFAMSYTPKGRCAAQNR